MNFVKSDKELLSKRELEVFSKLSLGLSYNQIARQLLISEGTVRKHIENIYGKLNVHNKLEAINKFKQL